MSNIKELTKNTLSQLGKVNIPTVPKNYFVEFRKQSETAKVKVEEFALFDKIKEALTNDEKDCIQINTFNDLAVVLVDRVSSNELKTLIEAFNEILLPSVDFNFIEEIEDFILKILEDPKKLILEESVNELKKISKKRIDSDRKVLKDKTDDIVKLTSLMSRYFDKTLSDGENSTDEILKIKDELFTLNISNSSHRELKIVQTKLIDTIFKIENSMKINNTVINESKEKFNHLQEQIEALQEELSIVKEEKQIDYLTNILNRRAYQHEMEKMEKKYSIFASDYAIVFYDIDHFKNINDVYGHTCGDAVLKGFANILKKLTRKEDIIARYGGEEFIALINYQEEVELDRYLKRVKKVVETSNFIYKNTSIKVNFSGGVSFRSKYNSYQDAEKKADDLLYEAKHRGRNKIIFDNGVEI